MDLQKGGARDGHGLGKSTGKIILLYPEEGSSIRGSIVLSGEQYQPDSNGWFALESVKCYKFWCQGAGCTWLCGGSNAASTLFTSGNLLP